MDEERSVEREEAMTVPYGRAARGCTAAVVFAFAALVVWSSFPGTTESR